MGLPRIGAYDLPTAAEIPPPRGPWRLERDRAALLIHDMQRYFIAAYAPGTAPIAPAIVNMQRLLARCRAAAIPVIYTCQPGNQDPRDRGLQKDLWGPGMTAAPEHRDVVAELSPVADDFVLTKHRYSAFQRSNLDTLLRGRGRDQLIITGVFSHIGCLQTAGEAFQRDIEPFFAADASADFSREQHDTAMRYIADCCGVAMTTTDIETALA